MYDRKQAAPKEFVVDYKFDDVRKCLLKRGWVDLTPHPIVNKTKFKGEKKVDVSNDNSKYTAPLFLPLKYDLLWLNYRYIKFRFQPSNVILNHIEGSVHFSIKALLCKYLNPSINPSYYSFRHSKDYPKTDIESKKQETNCLFYPYSWVATNISELENWIYDALYREATNCLQNYEKLSSSLGEACKKIVHQRGLQTEEYPVKAYEILMQHLFDDLRFQDGPGSFSPSFSHLRNNPLYIVKPTNSSCGKGIVVTKGLVSTLNCLKKRNFDCIVQKYIEKPFLIHKRKFDIRVWVCITNLEPLVMWQFSEGYLRFTSKPYSVDEKDLNDSAVHLCNFSIQQSNEDYNASRFEKSDDTNLGESTTGYPNMWTTSRFRRYLWEKYGKDVYTEQIQPQIKHIIISTVRSLDGVLKMRPKTSNSSARFRTTDSGAERQMNISGAFEWLGFDLILEMKDKESCGKPEEKSCNDSWSFHVSLLEVNISPDISHSTNVTAYLCPSATEDLITLLFDKCLLGKPEKGAEEEYFFKEANERKEKFQYQYQKNIFDYSSIPNKATATPNDTDPLWYLIYNERCVEECNDRFDSEHFSKLNIGDNQNRPTSKQEMQKLASQWKIEYDSERKTILETIKKMCTNSSEIMLCDKPDTLKHYALKQSSLLSPLTIALNNLSKLEVRDSETPKGTKVMKRIECLIDNNEKLPEEQKKIELEVVGKSQDEDEEEEDEI